ncbi:MAG: hypothetical protein M3Y68_09365 [Chloroflexota bacterium]|nr:hypothetical protein [Chloroflexota bacterium]
MSTKKTTDKQARTSESRRARALQIFFAIFSILLILSMVLASLSSF